MLLSALIEGLSDPAAWGRAADGPVAVLHTHVSVLFFHGQQVAKLKKPVDLGFLDFTTPERRRHFCREEVRLNARLAPDVYLGVVPIVPRAGGGLALGPLDATPAQAVDWAVLMRRLPAERMLDRLLEEGVVDNRLMDDLARVLVGFHAAAARGPAVDRHGSPQGVRHNVLENFEQLEPFVGDLVAPAVQGYLCGRAERFLEERGELLAARVREGRVCEGHGDLHAGNVCVEDVRGGAADAAESGSRRFAIYDCIEFNERFRCGDVACDLAFLTMDLDRRGFGAFGDYLAWRYAELAGDPALPELVDFYEEYRALVRGKVAAFLTRDAGAPAELRAAKRREALGYLNLAARYGLPPALMITVGLPASGKSTLARHLARVCDAALLRSDVRRKSLAGLRPDARVRPGVGQGLYSPANVAHTYESLAESADEALQAGRSVIVDATFSRAAQRAPFEFLAAQRGVPLLALWVQADEAETRRRLAAREAEGRDASDADLSVYESARRSFEPPEELPARRVLHLASGHEPLEQDAARVIERRVALLAEDP